MIFITCLSIVFGTALGFAAFLLCRKGNPVANAVTRFCVWLVQGMPVVVLLILAAILTFLVNRIELRIDPRRRTKEQILRSIEKSDAAM